MHRSIPSRRLVELLGVFERTPAYVGLADALTVLIGDGRIALDVRLPSERDLAAGLGVSRTTVTRAYALLVETGFAVATRGAGTFTRVPGGRSRAHDQALTPSRHSGVIDLTCAAATAPPGIAEAYAAAAAELPAYLGGHGYFPVGLPALQEAIAATYAERGLPTRPDQIMVTSGALGAAAVAAQALVGTGDRVLVETPTYPNAAEALRRAGGRLVPVPVDPDGWDLDGTIATVRQSRPRAAYLMPDFQNPTGLVMSGPERERLGAALTRAGTVAIVDEAHQGLALDGQEMPPPLARFAPGAVTIGSASKLFWGGLRIGWLRVPDEVTMDRLVASRLSVDLGSPLIEQLAMVRLLADPGPLRAAQVDRLRRQRSALVAALSERLPAWEVRVPAGGLCLWCRLPVPAASTLVAAAERGGVAIAAGPIFAVDGGLERFVRIPYARPEAELVAAVEVLAEVWAEVSRSRTVERAAGRTARRASDRVIVA
ncbi:PLP-dependent aminotransferase family protein [Nocardioides sp. BP30]|uniref:MocR-like transcription factor YczR n=1 Tax=Nocardioides sp. BP30 TaxID=3036374 RepID=UPI00246958B8|nr:PLP-dependent aminotransferase family protein [Nocardioides sp. BP30]WGL50446.1 PLP-dependent aminotransferase family protein [Nocardioides sp. BP30]